MLCKKKEKTPNSFTCRIYNNCICKMFLKVFKLFLFFFSNANTVHLKISNANVNTFEKYLKYI